MELVSRDEISGKVPSELMQAAVIGRRLCVAPSQDYDASGVFEATGVLRRVVRCAVRRRAVTRPTVTRR